MFQQLFSVLLVQIQFQKIVYNINSGIMDPYDSCCSLHNVETDLKNKC